MEGMPRGIRSIYSPGEIVGRHQLPIEYGVILKLILLPKPKINGCIGSPFLTKKKQMIIDKKK